jgi:hypothetical protein
MDSHTRSVFSAPLQLKHCNRPHCNRPHSALMTVPTEGLLVTRVHDLLFLL